MLLFFDNIHIVTLVLMIVALLVWLLGRQVLREVFAWLWAREASLRVVPRFFFAKLEAAEFLARSAMLLLLFLAETFTLRNWVKHCHPAIFERYDPIIRKVIIGGFKAGVVVAVFLVLRKMSHYLYEVITSRLKTVAGLDSHEREQRAKTLVGMLRGIFTSLLVVVAVIWILWDEFGISVFPLLTGAGLAGLIVAFSVQSLIRDFFAGFFIILENQYKLGDLVRIADKIGTVESLSLRVTILREENGAVHFIPNGEVKVVSNMSIEWARAIVDIAVPFAHEPSKVLEILTLQAAAMMEDESVARHITGEPVIAGMNEALMSGSVYRVMFRTKPRKDLVVAREFRGRATAALFAAGIPFAPIQPGTVVPAKNTENQAGV